MGRAIDKLRLSRVFGLSAWASAVAFGVIRLLGRALPWDRWLEVNEFLDTVLDHGGKLERRGTRVVVEQELRQAGGRLRAELRPETSDLPTWVQIASLEEYGVVVDVLGSHGRASVRTLVDAGANIGLATLFFAQAFPDSRILALEPDVDNHRLLVHNLRGLSDRVECLQAAFWPEDELLQMDPAPFRGGREWARTVRRQTSTAPSARGPVAVVTPAGADARLGGDGIDLLKMDIEGAEAEFFADAERRHALLSRVDAIALEVHPERIEPVRVVEALDEAGFLVFPGREILVGVRRSSRAGTW